VRLFLVRHGETCWNKDEIFRGQIDVKLNEHGLEQARLTAAALRALDLSAIYTSPLQRAAETARLIAEPHGLPVVIEPGLTDLDYGSWQGLSHEQVQREQPELYQQWVNNPQLVHFQGGESLADIRSRVLEFYRLLAKRHHAQNVVAVSHRVVNKVLLCALLGLDNSRFWRLRQDTCGINVIDEDNRYGCVIRRINDTCHIQPLAAAFAANNITADF